MNRMISFERNVTSRCLLIVGILLLALPSTAYAQGEDGTRAERNLLVIAEMLPGRFDNANQSYFDSRLKEPAAEQHPRFHTTIKRVEALEIGEYVFSVTFDGQAEGDPKEYFLYSLAVNNDGWSVRMKIYAKSSPDDDVPATYLPGCDIFWLEEAGQFRAIQEKDNCRIGSHATLAREILLSQDALWVKFRADPRRHYTLERARPFSCYLDVPGVGGGRDIPYKRYQIPSIHDRGGEVWTTLDDGSEISIRLQNIRWPMNNLKNIFTRHSFVIYINKREGGKTEEITYAWAAPDAQRIGVNLKWMLVNCFMINNENVTPFFKTEPRL